MTNPPKLPNQAPKKKRPKATEILVANLSLPGSGTMLAGQKVHGACQLATAGSGFVMTTYFAVWFVMDWVRTGVFPMNAVPETGGIPESWIKPLLVGLGGVVLFVLALAWAFLTSLVIGNELKRTDPDA